MKKIIVSIMLVACMLAWTAGIASAAETEKFIGGMGSKFVRGVINTFTGWIEFPAQIVKGFSRGFGGDPDNKLAGVFVGIFDGVWQAVGRTMWGFRDMAGFWAADPANNDGIGIPLDAEYAWEDGTPYDPWKPDFAEGTIAPMGNKLLRGAGDALFGFVEIPGQIAKGIKLRAPDVGIGKGLWYWFSRELDGIYDVVTFFVPNPKDNKGLAFDEKWAWTALSEKTK
jgi:putative exosortase-associated protein (TIGR04073 family)